MTVPPASLQLVPELPLAEFYNVNPATIPDPTPTPGPVEALVARVGDPALLIRCIEPVFDDYDSFDPAASAYDVLALRAVVSPLGEKEVRTLAGRGVEASRKATLSETVRVRSDRPGQGDLVVTIPDAAAISAEGSQDVWTVTITPRAPAAAGAVQVTIPTAYPVAFASGDVVLGTLDRDEYRVYRVADSRQDRHPFTGVTKNTIYLQEVVG